MNRTIRQLAYNISPRREKIVYLVIHDTGNPATGADAEAHFSYFNGGNRNSSADFFVDDRTILQVNDYTRYYTWHCGDGGGRNGIRNSNSIGIELCINQDGDGQKAIENLMVLVEELMDALFIPKERVVRHFDASGKQCPGSMAQNGWEKWKRFYDTIGKEKLLMSQYEELSGKIQDLTETVKAIATEVGDVKNPVMYQAIDETLPEWAREAVQWAVEERLVEGDGQGLALTEDKIWLLVVLHRFATK